MIHNHNLDQEIDINLGREFKGEIRTSVETKYADLEKLLSSNLGDKLKEICDIQIKPSIPKPTLSIHNKSLHGINISQFTTIQNCNESIDVSREISMFAQSTIH